jgi:O-antigen/teichoic acid export membrane protein
LLAEKDDNQQMRAIFQSTWVMVSLLSMFILIPVLVIVWFANPGQLLGLTRITGDSLSVTLLLLFLYVAASMQTGILQVPFRAMKKNPISVAAVNLIRLVEWAGATFAVLMGGTVIDVALAFFLVRVIGNAALWYMLHSYGSVLKIGIRFASMKTIRLLLRPSLASMCFPLGLSFTMQGFILIVSHVIGPGGVALFSIYRTFTRVPIQLATAINQAVWPELSYAFGANDMGKANRLVWKMEQFGGGLGLLAAVSIYFAGVPVIDFWVSKSIHHDYYLLIALTLAGSIHILWQPFWVALMAINKHTRFALSFVVISAASLVLGWLFLNTFELRGSGYAILLCECLMAIAAYAAYRHYFNADGHD